MIKKILTVVLLAAILLSLNIIQTSADSSLSTYDKIGVKYYPNGYSIAICNGFIAVEKTQNGDLPMLQASL